MDDFLLAEPTPEQLAPEYWMERGFAPGAAEQAARVITEGLTLKNSKYQVTIRRFEYTDWPSMYHLSIKRIDREPIHDWRDLQQIKSKLIGPQNEGVELYPAESRLADNSNQYHLYVLVDPTLSFPFGFKDKRSVSTPEQAAAHGAKQRPFPVEET